MEYLISLQFLPVGRWWLDSSLFERRLCYGISHEREVVVADWRLDPINFSDSTKQGPIERKKNGGFEKEWRGIPAHNPCIPEPIVTRFLFNKVDGRLVLYTTHISFGDNEFLVLLTIIMK
jgi:hypothetical protein